MADNLSEGPVQVFSDDVMAINDALRQLCERMDHIKGLRGRVLAYDRVRGDDPTEQQDAVTLGAGPSSFVTLANAQTVAGEKTFSSKQTFAGEVQMTAALNHDGSTVGFFGTTPGIQGTAYADRTDSTGGVAGTAGGPLTDPTDAPATADALRDDLVANLIPNLRDSLATLTTAVNEALAALRRVGLIAT